MKPLKTILLDIIKVKCDRTPKGTRKKKYETKEYRKNRESRLVFMPCCKYMQATKSIVGEMIGCTKCSKRFILGENGKVDVK